MKFHAIPPHMSMQFFCFWHFWQFYGHGAGIYNCKAGDFDASDVTLTSSFDYKSFMEPLVHLACTLTC